MWQFGYISYFKTDFYMKNWFPAVVGGQLVVPALERRAPRVLVRGVQGVSRAEHEPPLFGRLAVVRPRQEHDAAGQANVAAPPSDRLLFSHSIYFSCWLQVELTMTWKFWPIDGKIVVISECRCNIYFYGDYETLFINKWEYLGTFCIFSLVF